MTDKRIRLISSSTASTIKIEKDTAKLRNMLDAHVKNKYDDIDLTMPENEQFKNDAKRRDNGTIILPQLSVHRDGAWQFLGDYEEIELLNEDGELKPLLVAIANA